MAGSRAVHGTEKPVKHLPSKRKDSKRPKARKPGNREYTLRLENRFIWSPARSGFSPFPTFKKNRPQNADLFLFAKVFGKIQPAIIDGELTLKRPHVGFPNGSIPPSPLLIPYFVIILERIIFFTSPRSSAPAREG